jgi:tetratricopeptide (TPR) repeat protein
MGEDHALVATLLTNLASAASMADEDELALRHAEAALRIYERTHGADHHDTAYARNHYANALLALDRNDEARGEYARALAAQEKELDPGHPHLASTLMGLASAETETGRAAEAIAHARRAIEIYDGVDNQMGQAEARFRLAAARYQTGARAEARALAEEALARPGVNDRLRGLISRWLADHP